MTSNFEVGRINLGSKQLTTNSEINNAISIAADLTKVPIRDLSAEVISSTEGDVVEINIVASVPWCVGCFNLKAQVADLELKISSMEEKSNASIVRALLRQLAINIEYELKLILLELIPKDERQQYLVKFNGKNRIDEGKVMSTHLQDFKVYASKGNFAAFRKLYSKAVGESDNSAPLETSNDLDELVLGLQKLKKGFIGGAHPTNKIDGTDADLDYCSRFFQSFDGLPPRSKALVQGQIEDLGRIRKKKNQSQFLFA